MSLVNTLEASESVMRSFTEMKSGLELIHRGDVVSPTTGAPRLPLPIEVVVSDEGDVDDWMRFPRGFIHLTVFDRDDEVRFGVRVRTHNGSLVVLRDFPCPIEAAKSAISWRTTLGYAELREVETSDWDLSEMAKGREFEASLGVDHRNSILEGRFTPFEGFDEETFDGSDFGRWPHEYYFPRMERAADGAVRYYMSVNAAARLGTVRTGGYPTYADCSAAILERMADMIFGYGMHARLGRTLAGVDPSSWDPVCQSTRKEPAWPSDDPAPCGCR